MQLKYFKNLDGVRAYAALMVLVFHFFGNGFADYSSDIIFYKKITEFGQHGVSLFFVLSGFVISRILIKNKSNEGYFSNFYIRRTLRIFPLYYLYLVLHYFVFPLIFESPFSPFQNQLPYYFYVQNFRELLDYSASGPGHFWSLAVEEHFYLIWPLVIFLTPLKKIYQVCYAGLVFLLLVKLYLVSQHFSINYLTITRVDQIIIGSLIAVFEYEGKLNKVFFNAKRLFIILIGTFGIGVGLYVFSSQFYEIKQVLKYPIMSVYFFAFIVVLVVYPHLKVFQIIFENKLIQPIGKISYGFYVYHIFGLELMEKFFRTEIIILDFLIAFLLTFGIALLSFNTIEKYFMNLKQKLAPKI